MKVILFESVEKLGERGDVRDVSIGYARNYLFPKKLAKEATEQNIVNAQRRMEKIRLDAIKEIDTAKEMSERLSELSITISAQVTEGDKLYGSVSAAEITDALKEEGYDIDKRKVLLEDHIRELGIYQVPIKLHAQVETEIKVWVVKA